MGTSDGGASHMDASVTSGAITATKFAVDSLRAYLATMVRNDAVVYRTKEPPLRYACPRCFGDRKIQFLQDLKVYCGGFRCPDCKVTYPVDERKQAKVTSVRAPRALPLP
jgi:hypothetical protein